MIGQVYKVHTDSYSVKCGEYIYKCGARGMLKKRGEGILVGDVVNVENQTIISVKERKNRFIRPNVSNVDLVVGVVSVQPKPDFFVLDKLYLNAVKEGVDFVIVVNKTDISQEIVKLVYEEYGKLGVKILEISTKTQSGIDDLIKILKGKLTVLAGQSAVGKTSIVNTLFGLDMKVGTLSEKISRGKHTTTRSEIFENGDIRLVDTPGFAVIDAMLDVEDLPLCYPEYFQVSNYCKFRGCTHVNEPECEVKKLVENGTLSKKRYERYVEIYKEISIRRNIYEKH